MDTTNSSSRNSSAAAAAAAAAATSDGASPYRHNGIEREMLGLGGLIPQDILDRSRYNNNGGRKKGNDDRRFKEAVHRLRCDLPETLRQPTASGEHYTEDVQFVDNITGIKAVG